MDILFALVRVCGILKRGDIFARSEGQKYSARLVQYFRTSDLLLKISLFAQQNLKNQKNIIIQMIKENNPYNCNPDQMTMFEDLFVGCVINGSWHAKLILEHVNIESQLSFIARVVEEESEEQDDIEQMEPEYVTSDMQFIRDFASDSAAHQDAQKGKHRRGGKK
jgi:hypothetical protein